MSLSMSFLYPVGCIKDTMYKALCCMLEYNNCCRQSICVIELRTELAPFFMEHPFHLKEQLTDKLCYSNRFFDGHFLENDRNETDCILKENN